VNILKDYCASRETSLKPIFNELFPQSLPVNYSWKLVNCHGWFAVKTDLSSLTHFAWDKHSRSISRSHAKDM